MKLVETKNAPAAIGPYSQGALSTGFIFTSGQLGINPETNEFAGDNITAQTEQAIRNIAAILKALGSDLSCVVKTTCYLANIADFEQFNKVYEQFFTGRPARSCVQVAALPKGALVEIEAIAE